MKTDRYPEELVVTVQDFDDCGWQAALPDAGDDGYAALWQSFSDAARKALDEQRTSQGKVLWLLADACSMMLRPASIQEPFKPFMVMEGRRSTIPEDFSEADILFLSTIVERITDPRVRSRLADLVWLTQRKLGVGFALSAIDAYRSMPLNQETWLRDGRECWTRALGLALMLKDGAGERLNEMEAAITAAFESTSEGDGFLSLWLAQLLFDNRLGRYKAAGIASKLRQTALAIDGEGDHHRARAYFEAAMHWFQRLGDVAGAAEMTVALAETWAKEAVARTTGSAPSYMVAADFYEKAIQTFRDVPRAQRAAHRVDERIAELHKSMSEAGKRSLDEMGMISSPGMDVRELVEAAQAAVRGKPVLDALAGFLNLYEGAKLKQLQASSERTLREHPLQALFAATYMSKDGRVIAKRPVGDFGGTVSQQPQLDPAVWAQMIRQYQGIVSLVVQAEILPALQTLQLEHRLREDDFVALTHQSPLVPTHRERLFGKSLFAGYDNDFAVALHLLVPQVEHLVRSRLKAAGAKTTNLDREGVENENGLSTLVDLPEMLTIFGEDLSFELKALFCDALGPNLRNEFAHGLLDDRVGQSLWAIYAWWLVLKLVFNTYRNAPVEPE